MTSRGDQLVEEYLRRLDNASVFLAEERRAELRQEIAEHIAAGTEEAEAAHAEAVSAVLDRLGPPADIVASETGSGSGPGSTGSGPVVAERHGPAGYESPGYESSGHGSAGYGAGTPGSGAGADGRAAAPGQDSAYAAYAPGPLTKGEGGPSGGGGAAGLLRGRSRKLALVLAGAVVAAVALGTMAIGASSSDTAPSTVTNEPTAPSESESSTGEPEPSETTGSGPPSESPEIGGTDSAEPSADTSTQPSEEPEATPSETETG